MVTLLTSTVSIFKKKMEAPTATIKTTMTERPKPFLNSKSKEEQIIETRDKPQHLATQRLLSCLQYPDATKSSTKDLSIEDGKLRLVGVIFVDWCQPMKSGRTYSFTFKSTINEKHCLVSMASDLEAFSR